MVVLARLAFRIAANLDVSLAATSRSGVVKNHEGVAYIRLELAGQPLPPRGPVCREVVSALHPRAPRGGCGDVRCDALE